ncbi:hypothetical protein RPMA_10520 [Tardiphaga alba]|uniref:Collagen-like protein n=1 Tax=Tardiphaga alba TaxID=340268 RepID=A0ABX8A6E5_9BRAD|nr:hypothetical protein [Tardiphaga alba]QUS39223.1 hypothetical protein RPMA_10520 [Tardiphaga alba]
MTTLLNGSDNNRLAEVLAGSAALLSATSADAASQLPLNALLGEDTISADATIDDTATAGAHAQLDPIQLDLAADASADTSAPDMANLLGLGDIIALQPDTQLDLAHLTEPVADTVQNVVGDLHLLGDQGDLIQLPVDLAQQLTDTVVQGAGSLVSSAAGGNADPVTGLLGTPLGLLNGGLLNGGLGDTIEHVGETVGSLVHSLDDLLGNTGLLDPVADLVTGLTGSLNELPILGNLLGGASGDNGGAQGGLLGGILDIPNLGGAGTDALTGTLLGPHGLVGGLLGGELFGGEAASDASASAHAAAPLDLVAGLTDVLTGDHGILDLHGAHII